MQAIRRRGLAAGWYPTDLASIRDACSRWPRCASEQSVASAVIVPHAGWAYSGHLAYYGISAIDPAVETLAVVGGHLAAGQPLLMAPEDAFETPLGSVQADAELRARIADQLESSPDRSSDNSVEIHLPLVAHLFPRARVLWLRAPADQTAIALGRLLAEAGTGRRLGVVGSTDLTHFGPRFGLTRPGSLQRNQQWAERVNDRGFLDLCRARDAAGLLAHAAANQSACSPGAAAAAVAFSLSRGDSAARELGYDSSFRRARDENFVGYGAVAFQP
ncbi:MAG: AmmeMemoRadiSam system protein B [Spirochaetaceae bacterium]|nr:MAG: AmmeMemoRadiSam system protein B [Spirochaetaceae bacterium]